MTYQQQFGTTIQDKFNEFHKDNPVVYKLIKEETLKLFRQGAKKVSIKRVVNVIRWDRYIVIKEPTLFDAQGGQRRFRINDIMISRYNRLFIQDHPEYKDKIEIRRLRSV